jgi:hypothetical protein
MLSNPLFSTPPRVPEGHRDVLPESRTKSFMILEARPPNRVERFAIVGEHWLISICFEKQSVAN